MKIIFEGPDGVGKSTLAKSLGIILDTTAQEFDEHADNSVMAWADRMHVKSKHTIWSRSFLSERIYADVYEREPRLTESEEMRLIILSWQLKYEVIICMPKDLTEYKKRLKKRGDTQAVLDNIDKIVERYKIIIERYNLKVIMI